MNEKQKYFFSFSHFFVVNFSCDRFSIAVKYAVRCRRIWRWGSVQDLELGRCLLFSPARDLEVNGFYANFHKRIYLFFVICLS